MKPIADLFFKIATPFALIFVGVSTLLTGPKVDQMNATLKSIRADVQEIAKNPAPLMFSAGKAGAEGVAAAISEKAGDVRENGLSSDTVKSAKNTAIEVGKGVKSKVGNLFRSFVPAEQKNDSTAN